MSRAAERRAVPPETRARGIAPRLGASAGRIAVLAALLLASCQLDRSQLAQRRTPVAPAAPPAADPTSAPEPTRQWRRLSEDGIRDPLSPALRLLQQPAEALSVLPPDTGGNQVNWVAALREGHINPRTNVRPETNVRVLDLDILMVKTGSLNAVLFPHRAHTEWLDCANCHERIFRSKAGATRFNMLAILQGEACGQCHGAVSFPLTHCARCHSVPAAELERLRAVLPTR